MASAGRKRGGTTGSGSVAGVRSQRESILPNEPGMLLITKPVLFMEFHKTWNVYENKGGYARKPGMSMKYKVLMISARLETNMGTPCET